MGLYAFEIEAIARICRQIKKPFRVLSFGHPDILATARELEPLIGPIKVDNKEVLEERSHHPKPDIVGNAVGVFKNLGGELVVADARPTYNVQHLIDLNHPGATRAIDGKFALVIDPGTTEHCFNPGNALVNMASKVEQGGFIYHRVPLCHWNHGFWNFSPCVFADFYEQNGFVLTKLTAERNGRYADVQARKKFEIPHHGRKLQLICIAQRVKEQEIALAVQYKYA